MQLLVTVPRPFFCCSPTLVELFVQRVRRLPGLHLTVARKGRDEISYLIICLYYGLRIKKGKSRHFILHLVYIFNVKFVTKKEKS